MARQLLALVTCGIWLLLLLLIGCGQEKAPPASLSSEAPNQTPVSRQWPVSREIQEADRLATEAARQQPDITHLSKLAQVRVERALAIVTSQPENPSQAALEEAALNALTATLLTPQVPEHQLILGTIYGDLVPWDERASVMAEAALTRAVELDPDLAQGWLQLGLLQAEQGRGIEAMASLERALESDPPACATLASGPLVALYAAYDQAGRGRAVFSQLAADNPEGLSLWLAEALLVDLVGERALAQALVTDVLSLAAEGSPERAKALELLNEWGQSL